jgi:copper(I)-binding protein
MIMLRTAIPSLPSRRTPAPTVRMLVRTGAAGLMVALGAALAGCAQPASASGPTIELGTAYVGQPQGTSPTDAYLVIRNKGPADKLVSVRTSVGGTVTLRGPVSGGPIAMRNVAAINVPADQLIRLDPNGYHLVLTGTRPMKAGTEITLTLTFAKAGSYQVAAEVTNAQTGGSSYFLN